MRSRSNKRDLDGLAKLRKALHRAVNMHKDEQMTSSKQTCNSIAPKVGDETKPQQQGTLQASVKELVATVPERHRNSFPMPPNKAEEEDWVVWWQKCIAERKQAAKHKEKIVGKLKQKASAAARRHTQTMYNNNPKRWNKRILKGGDNNARLLAVLNKDTGKQSPRRNCCVCAESLPTAGKAGIQKNKNMGIPT